MSPRTGHAPFQRNSGIQWPHAVEVETRSLDKPGVIAAFGRVDGLQAVDWRAQPEHLWLGLHSLPGQYSDVFEAAHSF